MIDKTTTAQNADRISSLLSTATGLLMVEAADHAENRVLDPERRKKVAMLLRDFIDRANFVLNQGA